MNSVTYPFNGFGALVNTKTSQVLVYGSNLDPYDAINQKFKTLTDVAPGLSGIDLTSSYTLEFTDSNGVTYVVGVVPTFYVDNFPSQSAGSPSVPALTMLVFAVKSEATKPLISLKSNINTTTNNSYIVVLIICLGTAGAVMIFIALLVEYITNPLTKLREISAKIIQISADEDTKDYSPIVQMADMKLGRSDEVRIELHILKIIL